MNKELTIKQSVVTRMVSELRTALPNEGCGYLAGANGCVDTLYPLENIDHSPEHFSFRPEDQFSVLKSARSAGKELQVVYHSHPETPPRLSEEDLRLLNDPSMVYIIVSFKTAVPGIKAYQIDKSNEAITVHEVELNIIGD
ncbi:MAG: M67 family metallopeptidase [Candidatus Marinamargulisbacteria bacterium]|jgi:[CysO sulfur-carrier protein]-S-L-cysteine hydrolase|nr:M67 family metallopeptidase [Candidatus Marinamargulisbacteria bacterium]|tara:strand:+ start:5407 stop:5829 length:423 start_codon:yes stop_codon:yes gene_type:complete